MDTTADPRPPIGAERRKERQKAQREFGDERQHSSSQVIRLQRPTKARVKDEGRLSCTTRPTANNTGRKGQAVAAAQTERQK
jgi:hypothetical protein